MDTEVDLTTVDRAVLIAIIAELQAVIERLQRRVAELEGQAKPDGPPRMPGHKPSSGRQPPAQQEPRKQRRHGFARPRMTPTHRVEHVMENCPDCGTHRSGGWTQRTREVIELPVVPVQVTEHVYLARTCPACRRRCTPPAVLDGVVLGQQRLGVNLLSLIATLREEGRLPIRSVQWYLDTVHQLRLSVGAIVSAIHQTAQQAQPAVAAILDRIRASPVVHADETGWREDGANGYVWTFSIPTERYFLRTLLPAAGSGQGGGGRSAGRVVLRSIGQRFLRRLPPLRWPQATVLGPPAAGHPRPAHPLPQRRRTGPMGRGSPTPYGLQTLWGLRERPEGVDGVHPMIAQAQADAVSSQLADLEAELREYESVRAGEFRMDRLRVVADLPALLIKARISQGLSQKELADRLGLKEQQIQRYEATDYATAKWSRIREVASAFGIDLSNPAPPVVSR